MVAKATLLQPLANIASNLCEQRCWNADVICQLCNLWTVLWSSHGEQPFNGVVIDQDAFVASFLSIVRLLYEVATCSSSQR